jgi:glycerol-3-phosphate dehydrogenase
VPINDVIIFTSIDGERGMYAVPWGNTVIVGTTDLNHQGELDGVYATQDEVTSMLAAVNHVFPAAQLSIQDVFSSFAGLRPLVGEVESSGYTASRDHEIFESPSGLVSISGGKLTTHRKMAKDLVDHVVAKLYKEGMLSEKKPCTSAESPLSSLANVSNDEQTRLAKVYPNLDQNIIKHLVDTYGLNAEKILSMPNGQDNLLERIIPDCAYIYAEIPYAIQHEMAMTLSDILIRRTHIIYEARDLGLGAASKIAEIMGSYLGWDSARKEREILDYQEKVMLARTFLPGAPQTSN